MGRTGRHMLQLKHIRKAYKTSDFTQVALDDVSVTFRDSEFVAVLGPSGSGKTTMLNVLGGLDHADSGDIVVNGVSTRNFTSKDWDTYRNHRIGFVFQSYNLIPHQSVLSNVELALTLSGVGRAERRRRATKALQQVGLGEHLHKRPSQLSGGQMQRVAIARALVNDPDIVLADEPTGALDTETGIQVMDILKDVSKDRLVVMVTHNPELAKEYATRIVRVRDGRVVDDTNPLTLAELAAAEVPADSRQKGKPKRHASMSYLTALSLSFNNLWSKKGRTILTAFAGSIGIIGIAAILAISNGVNAYIAKVEQDTLSNYPLEITRSSADATSLMTSMMSAQGNATDTTTKAPTNTPSGSDQIPETTSVSDMFSEIKSNDLKSFREFLESGGNGIWDHVSTISYDYGITPYIYSSDTSSGVTRLGTLEDLSSTSSLSKARSSLGISQNLSAFEEMMDDQDLLSSQYDVVAGNWPTAANEAVLVLGKDGSISDYTLYMMGVLDPNQLRSLVDSVGSTNAQVDVPDTSVDFTYDDALGMTFKFVSPSSLYQKNEQSGTWTDMSFDADFMKNVVDNDSTTLKIVGVVRPNATTETTSLSEGVAYTHALTLQLMQQAAGSRIVQEQMAKPDVDVFTGKTFDELRNQGTDSFDMSSIFSIDQDALKKAFAFDQSSFESALGDTSVDLSGMDLSSVEQNMDFSDLNLDTSSVSSVFDADTMAKLMAGAPQPDLSAVLDQQDSAQTSAVGEAANKLIKDFWAWFTKDGNLQKYEADDGKAALKVWEDYSTSDQGKAAIEEFNAVAQVGGDELQSKLQDAMSNYVTNQLAPYIQQQMDSLVQQAAQAMTAQLATALQSKMAAATQSFSSELSTAISSQLQSKMGNISTALQDSLSVDPTAFTSAIHFNMTQDDLTSLLMNYAEGSQLSYDNNLQKLGYADESNPQQIDLYPKSFDDKTAVLNIIDEYNQDAKDAGQDQKVISYSDMVGTLMSSVTDIVNLVSDVLIAFVSISLVVSSIMIAIITYISVLERKKEIGILRAMGASKFNVASVFNAETVIEGLISGVFAILVVLALEGPVNAYVLSWKNVPNIMALSPLNAIVLIAISVGLTLLAGLIPSTMAARRDPVEALRSE